MLVKNFNMALITVNNAILNWEIQNLDENYLKNYIVFISYKTCGLTIEDLIINKHINRVGNGTQFIYAFEKLCPNLVQEIKLSINTTLENKTIFNETIEFMALPTVPFIVPEVDVGSFFIDVDENVHIYWNLILKDKWNGDNLMIQITNEHKYPTNQLNNQTFQTESNYLSTAVLKKDWINNTLGAEIRLQAKNSIGFAKSASFIKIPSKDRLYAKPENIQVYRLNNYYHVS